MVMLASSESSSAIPESKEREEGEREARSGHAEGNGGDEKGSNASVEEQFIIENDRSEGGEEEVSWDTILKV